VQGANSPWAKSIGETSPALETFAILATINYSFPDATALQCETTPPPVQQGTLMNEDVGICLDCGVDYMFIIDNDPQRCDICIQDRRKHREIKVLKDRGTKDTLAERIKQRALRRKNRG